MIDKRILLIENDEAIAEILSYILTDFGYEVVESPAHLYLSSIAKFQPALILLDYSLNGHFNGSMICEHLKSDPVTCQIPVIIISGHIDIKQIARDCKADDFLPKPFDVVDLHKIVHKWMMANNNSESA